MSAEQPTNEDTLRARRGYQVSLRTLVMLMLLAGLIFSWIVFWREQSRHQASVVTGTITVNGKPMAGGKISFFAPNGNGQFVGSEIKSGKYKVDRVAAGEYSVAIEAGGIPVKYSSPDTSGLKIATRLGTNVVDLELRAN